MYKYPMGRRIDRNYVLWGGGLIEIMSYGEGGGGLTEIMSYGEED